MSARSTFTAARFEEGPIALRAVKEPPASPHLPFCEGLGNKKRNNNNQKKKYSLSQTMPGSNYVHLENPPQFSLLQQTEKNT